MFLPGHIVARTGTRATHTGLMALGRFVRKDRLEIRCPRLGGPVPFTYCMDPGDNTGPCFKIMDCWWEAFDIAAYIEANYSEEVCRKLAQSRPKPKVNQLLELIEAAKRRAEEQ